ncbi:MAG: dihydroneopterin aldolase [Phycisphaerales bacterium]|jgi:7,8-dihydroneopterin aldolase/epimerase/oxygenase|nr:dihydroneopterin aldolase [Phycisphaerales bacterium]
MQNMQIRIHQLAVEAIVGTKEHEQSTPQALKLNVTFEFDAAAAVAGDDLTEAVDYDTLCESISARLAERKYALIETLAQDVVALVVNDGRVTSAVVEVQKPAAVEAAEYISAVVAWPRPGACGGSDDSRKHHISR